MVGRFFSFVCYSYISFFAERLMKPIILTLFGSLIFSSCASHKAETVVDPKTGHTVSYENFYTRITFDNVVRYDIIPKVASMGGGRIDCSGDDAASPGRCEVLVSAYSTKSVNLFWSGRVERDSSHNIVSIKGPTIFLKFDVLARRRYPSYTTYRFNLVTDEMKPLLQIDIQFTRHDL